MKTITREQLIAMISAEKGTEMVGMHIETDPRMSKTGNPYVGATKCQSLSGIIGYDYENAVNNQLKREGKEATFEAEPRKWGTRLDNKWVEHNGERYVTLKVQSKSAPTFFLNGQEIPKESVEPFLPKKKVASTQDALEKKIHHTDIKICNVRSITMNHETYLIKD